MARRDRDGTAERLLALRQRADAIVEEGLSLGLRGGDIARLVMGRLSTRVARGPTRRIVLVGIFPAATAAYAHAVGEALGSSAAVEGVTLDALANDADVQHRAGSADLVLAMAHRRRDVEARLPGARVATVSFIPSEDTRRALASLPPQARVLAVSRFPDFLPLMRPGIGRFAPHVVVGAGVLADAADLAERVAATDAVVYATGAEAVLDQLPRGFNAIEYRHSPDPGDIDRIVRPLLDGTPGAWAREDVA